MIKVLFITNILCRHQVGLWDNISHKHDISFTYLSTRNTKGNISIRYMCGERNYEISSHTLDNYELNTLINSSDIIFYGSIEDDRIHGLINGRNNCFIISEHMSKHDYKELWKLRGLRRRISFNKNISQRLKHINKKYVFCASSFTGSDFLKAGAQKSALLKFGYFPTYKYASREDMMKKKENQILYVGRNILWKHPEIPSFVYKNLCSHIRCKLIICGEGLENYSVSNDKNSVYIKSMPNDNLADLMITSEIYLFTSDRREGWGVVLGEAMAAGCVVFANIYAGSTRYLVQDGINGFTYKTKRQLLKKIRHYLKMPSIQKNKIKLNAVNTMKLWSGTVCANRLNIFIHCFANNKTFKPYPDGPLSID